MSTYNRQARCSHCKLVRSRHSAAGSCPRGTTRWREPGSVVRVKRVRVPFSFNDLQVTALHEVLRCIQRGGDPRLIARLHSRELGHVLGIIERGRKRAQELAAPVMASAVNQSPPPATTASDAASGVGVAGSFGKVRP